MNFDISKGSSKFRPIEEILMNFDISKGSSNFRPIEEILMNFFSCLKSDDFRHVEDPSGPLFLDFLMKVSDLSEP